MLEGRGRVVGEGKREGGGTDAYAPLRGTRMCVRA